MPFFAVRFLILKRAAHILPSDFSNFQFGKQWFKPEEASGLRGKIHKLLLEEFKNAQKRSCTLESSPSSASDLVEE